MTIGKMTAQQLLGKCEVFSALTNAQLEKIASLALEKGYEAGTTIFKGGAEAAELLLIQEGKIALQMILPKARAQMNRKVTIDIVTRDDVVGWSVMVEPYVYTFTAVCLQDVKALSISGIKLRWLLQDDPKIGYNVLKGLIKVVALRLNETRQLLISERLVITESE